MPNHVTNILSFSGDEKEIDKLRNAIKGKFDDGSEMQIDFNKIIPRPESLNITAGSSTDYGIAVVLFREENNPQLLLPILEYPWVKAEGITTPEALAHYLVEEGSADLKEGKLALENKKKYGHKDWYSWSCANWGTKWNAYSQEDHGLNVITFDTAWAAPFPVIEKLSEMFPKVEITMQFAEEDFGYNCGEIIFLGGNSIKEDIPEGGSVEAIMMAGKIQGIGLEGYIDYFGNTEDKEWAEKLIEVIFEKYPHDEVVDCATSHEYISLAFLEVLKGYLIYLESYELIDKVDQKIKAMEQEGEN